MHIPNDSNLIFHVDAGIVLSLADLSKQFYDKLGQNRTVKSSCDQGNDATKCITSIIDAVKPRLRAKYGEQEYNLSMKQLECFFRSRFIFP